MDKGDAPAPFWEGAEPSQASDSAPAPTSSSEAAPGPVSLGILPAAPVEVVATPRPHQPAKAMVPEASREERMDARGMPMAVSQTDERQGTWVGVLFLLIFTLFWGGATLMATVFIGADLIEQHGTRTWEETPGTMEWSAVDTVTSCDDEGCSDEYCVEVEYRYGSEGQRSGDQLSTMEDCYESRRLAEKIVERYPAGADVTVYHHPDNINDAVLETGLAPRYLWLLAFLLPFQGISLVLLLILLKSAWHAIFSPSEHEQKGSS